MSARLPKAVIDTTLLTRLRDIELLDLLPLVFSAILIPDDVRFEVGRGPGKVGRWLTRVLREQGDFFRRCTEEDDMVRGLLEVDLDPGESAVIAQAYELGVAAIIDEKKGRGRASDMDVEVIPTLRVLLRLKETGFVEAIEPHIEQLTRTGFRLSDTAKTAVLAEAGEIDDADR